MYIATKGWTIIAIAERYNDLIGKLADSRGDKIEAVEVTEDYGLVSGLVWEMHVNGEKWPQSCTSANDKFRYANGYTKDEAIAYFLECYAKTLPCAIYNATRIK